MWIENLPNGKFKYYERYKDPYTEKWKKISITLDTNSNRSVKSAARLLSEKIDNKIDSHSISDITFKDLVGEWLKYYKVRVKRKSYLHALDTMEVINTVIKPEMLIKNIDSNLISKLIDKMYTFGKYSLNYTSQIKSTVSQIFKFAISKKYIFSNPTDGVKIVPKKQEEESRKIKIDQKYLEKNEVKLILERLYSTNRKANNGRIAEFLWLTGLRFGELQALQWKNFDGKSIAVDGTLDAFKLKISEAVKTTPKNINSRRIVDIPERAIEILEYQKQINQLRFGIVKEDDYIFVSVQNNPVVLNSFNTQLKKAGIESNIEKTLSSHIFRHSHVSLLAELNIPIKTIMQRVGHGDASTTIKIYNHVTNKSKQDVINALNKITL
ncbi:tyrosine-type recombinase/integrase [Lactococcus hircilactis]|uniref:Tyrosine-type recombinase/integrase n=1 Tax=Lactococcus hircilactis TaxID=1494462 RepID=A0A7X1Z8Z2_9LACT|nr:site-specific integrase [Lactococcus hircilactis]MQW40046.1 tyrosine-type recombinase/integrase [Lactococcus hircilactis]